MTSLILIHGGAHGAWCWEPVISPLRAAGHEVQAVDLPGRGGSFAGAEPATLDDWVATVSAAVDRAGAPPVLIAHSMGGLSASQLAERRPGDIARIIYVSAVVPADGEPGLAALQQAGPECALLVPGALTPTEDGSTLSVAPEHARIGFYDACPEPDVQAALARLCAEWVLPLATPLSLGSNFASVPKHYIGTTKDRAVPPTFQRMLAERCGAQFLALDADHSPFYSAPQEFVGLLLDLVKP